MIYFYLTNGSLWKATKRILNHTPLKPTPSLPRLDNSKVTDGGVGNFNVYAEHLATLFKPNNIQTNSVRVY